MNNAKITNTEPSWLNILEPFVFMLDLKNSYSNILQHSYKMKLNGAKEHETTPT